MMETVMEKRPLEFMRSRLRRYGFALLSDAPKGRVWCYLPTGKSVDDDEALRAVDEVENPETVLDFQI